MSFCSFGENAAMFDMTPIDNMFLLEYMPGAPRDYVCVYLYARMLCLHPELGGGIRDLTRALNMDEDAVFEAFAYWERQGLAERLSDNPPSFALRPVRSAIEQRKQVDETMYAYREYDFAIQALFGGENVEARYRVMANDWLTVLGFSQEAALMLLEYEMRLPGGKKQAAVFRRANKRAAEWAEMGVKTPEAVQRMIDGEDRIYRLSADVLKNLSIKRAPTEAERTLVRRWLEEWKFSEGDVLDACAQTTNARAPSFAYIDKILRSRYEDGPLEKYYDGLRAALRELGAAVKEPTPDQLHTYADLVAQGFEEATILLAAVQCARKRKYRFEDLVWMLGRWGELGLFTCAAAEKYVADMQQLTAEVRALLEQAGLSRRPTMDDLERYEEWKRLYSPELIACAAQNARGTRAPMVYMAKLLEMWRAEGVTTPEAVAARPRPKAAPAAAAGAKFDYQQREYKEEDFDRDRFNDLERLYGDGGDDK